MSDDCLWLKCNKCGEKHKLASIYLGDEAGKIPTNGTLEAFLNRHLSITGCYAWQAAWEGGAPHFSLATESSP
jgi:hypothetical protein